MARRTRKQTAERNMRILFGILAILVVASMVLSMVVTNTGVTVPPPTSVPQQSVPLPIATP